MFSSTSRYNALPTFQITLPGGRTASYVDRRLIPQPDQYALLQMHIVAQGERPDLIANQFLGDPEQFWRICDANNVIDPDELTRTPGRQVAITLPAGIPGAANA